MLTSAHGAGSDRPVGRLARGLYETRRREVLESVDEGLKARQLTARMDAAARTLTWRHAGLDMEAAFRTRRQLFGAHLHLVYSTAAAAGAAADSGSVGFQWGLARRRGFVARRGSSEAVGHMAQRLNADEELDGLLRGSSVRAVGVQQVADQRQWRVFLEPVPGVISVVYFPPIPPFAVRVKADEVLGHLEILTRIAGHISST